MAGVSFSAVHTAPGETEAALRSREALTECPGRQRGRRDRRRFCFPRTPGVAQGEARQGRDCCQPGSLHPRKSQILTWVESAPSCPSWGALELLSGSADVVQLARSSHPRLGRCLFPAPGQPLASAGADGKAQGGSQRLGGGRAVQSASAEAGEEEPFLLSAVPRACRFFFLSPRPRGLEGFK